jgi:hypothetical protein
MVRLDVLGGKDRCAGSDFPDHWELFCGRALRNLTLPEPVGFSFGKKADAAGKAAIDRNESPVGKRLKVTLGRVG